MAEQYVGKTAEFKDGDRRIIFAGENEIGIFRHQGAFYAYSNFCLHQGGPACEGLTIAKVEERILPDKTSQGLYFSDSEMRSLLRAERKKMTEKFSKLPENNRPPMKAFDGWYELAPFQLRWEFDEYLEEVPETIDGSALPIPGARAIIAP